MGKKVVILIVVLLIVTIILGIVIINLFSNRVYLEPSEECEVILENEGDDKVEIVFFTDNTNKDKVNEYISFFLDSSPFSSSKEKFNFYYAGTTNCNILEEIDKVLFCYSRDLLKRSSICPNDYIVVLSNHEVNIRSSSYREVISLNTNHDKNVFLHEFGHVFGNLADEYIPSEIPRKSKNCAKKCDDFEKYSVEGCFEGCSESDYFRSSEDSIMRTLKTNNYRDLNTFLINENLEKYE